MQFPGGKTSIRPSMMRFGRISNLGIGGRISNMGRISNLGERRISNLGGRISNIGRGSNMG